ncbi:sporulation histidine kinase inhibitor Sda [Effusibacillus dendaii]|uniref:Sporulation histidine kinase inhibitor Sda n=1 Tax=Effusibacillus dendaii TaxID=2743772 RepID=A0A7I8D5R4_9BACL|nr:sporulation histidine kinase inhibitor Sda [Effusibacillus dendaii]BCJ85474.1 hypothetical protein skT53_04590 [Effusibacillus dendaii]
MENLDLVSEFVLINSYLQAVKYGLEEEFTNMLFEEIERRGLELPEVTK